MADPSKSAKMYQVDAFTHEAFGGNSAAVVLLEKAHLPLSDSVRQAIAMEMNLSETAFLEVVDDADATTGASFQTATRFVLRWFTPAMEVPLCGHATIAAAAALFSGAGNAAVELLFDTVHSGQLAVRRGGSPTQLLLHMDLPLREPSDPIPSGITPSSDIVAAVGLSPSVVRDITFNAALSYLIICVWQGITRAQFEGIKPDFPRLQAACSGGPVGAVAITVPADDEGQKDHDVWARFFAPCMGINEDPVTGSLYAALGPYWTNHLQSATDGKIKGNKPEGLRVRQCSARGGDLMVKTDSKGGKVTVSGGAVLVVSGVLHLP